MVFAQKKGFSFIRGEYIQSNKNIMVKDLYKTLGFQSNNNSWLLDLADYISLNCFINVKQI